MTAYTVPVNYQDADREWVPIDNTFVDAPGSTYAVENAANAYTAMLPSGASTTPVRFVVGDQWVTMRLQKADAAPVVDGEVATYNSVQDAAEVRYTATGAGLKEDIVLSAPPVADLAFSYLIDASAELSPQIADSGAIEFRDTSDEAVVSVPLGVMSDSADQPAYSNGVDYDLVSTQSGWRLTVTPSYEWLTSPSRVYPVTVDPSLVLGPAATDCWIRSDSPNQGYCGNGSDYLRVGQTSGGASFRSLLKFDAAAVPADSVISDANLQVYLDSSQSASILATDYAVYRAGLNFDASATWNSAGAAGGWTGGNPSGSAMGTLSLSGTSSGYRAFSGLDDVVQGWADGSLPNRGLVLKQQHEGVVNTLWFYSSSTSTSNDGKRPKLNVTYTLSAPSTDAIGDASADGPEDAALLQDEGVLADEEMVSWVENQLEADDDPAVVRRGCVDPQGNPCPEPKSKYLTPVNHREGAGNPCTPGADGCTPLGHPSYTCSAAATRNMVETFTGVDKGEAWFAAQFDLRPVGLEGIKHISKTLRQGWKDAYHHTWVKRTPDSAVAYQARVITDINKGFPVVQNVRTEYLPYFGGHSLKHYNMAYGYDRTDKSVAIAEEWDPYFTWGVVSDDYKNGNPYGLHANVPRAKAFEAVHHSVNHAIVF